MANLFERAQAERKYNQFVKGVQSVVGLVETLSGQGRPVVDWWRWEETSGVTGVEARSRGSKIWH